MWSSLIAVAGGGIAYYGNFKAKEYHDLLEKAYNPHVDFKSLHAFCDSEIGRIFG